MTTTQPEPMPPRADVLAWVAPRLAGRLAVLAACAWLLFNIPLVIFAVFFALPTLGLAVNTIGNVARTARLLVVGR